MSINPDPTHIKISQNGDKVTITPHGLSNTTPSQDTINIQWTVNNYKHADIVIQNGELHISEMIEASGYQGVIKGQSNTTIVGRGPLIGNDYIFPMLNQDQTARLYPSGVPHLFWFHAKSGDVNDWKKLGTEVEFKNLSFRLDGVGPEITLNQQPFRSIWSFVIVTGSTAVLPSNIGTENVSHVSVKATNCHFTAQNTPYILYNNNYSNANVAIGILCYGGEHWLIDQGLNYWTEDAHSPVNCQYDIHDCTFSNLHQFGLGLEGFFTSNPNNASSYSFPTSPLFNSSTVSIYNNTFDNVGNGANIFGSLGFNILVLGSSETPYNIKGNSFLNTPANVLGFFNGIAETLPKLVSNFIIKDNNFDHISSNINGNSIWLIDLLSLYGGYYYDLLIKDNIFNGNTGYNNEFIELSVGKKCNISDNTFTGEALGAMTIGTVSLVLPVPLPVSECYITDNNLLGVSSINTKIVLGPGTSDNYVRVSHGSDVENSGYNNTIVVENEQQLNTFAGHLKLLRKLHGHVN